MNRVTENNFYEEENYNVVLKVYIFYKPSMHEQYGRKKVKLGIRIVEGEGEGGGGSFLLVKILRPVL